MALTQTPIPAIDLQRTYPRRFLPHDANLGEWSQIEPLYDALLERKPGSAAALEQWLADYFELCSAAAE